MPNTVWLDKYLKRRLKMLQPKERAKLRALASTLEDRVFIGQNGLTQNVVKEVSDHLYTFELVKVKVQKGADSSPKELAVQLANITTSEVVCVIGSKIVLYKCSSKKNIKHVL